MPVHQTFVTQLLRVYHGRIPAGAGLTNLLTIDHVKYLCDVGLGPIAFRMYGDEFRHSDPAIFSVLQSADLTTRVIYGQLEKAALDLAGELQGVGVTPTFLKGMSTSEEFYAPPYLRVMSDIDILIQHSEIDLVMTKVADLGYEITDEQWRMYREFGHHHLPEARHPETGVTIEVHTGLFAAEEFYSGECVFQPDNIIEQIIEFDFKGIRVARFTPEFQFIYTISKWNVDVDWGLNLKNINDIIHILRKYESEFDWLKLSKWFAASPHLLPITAALLDYLEKAGICTVSPQLSEMLAGADRKLGSRKLKVLEWILHTFPFNARGKVYATYARRSAHALWLYLSKPSGRHLGITRSILHQLYLSAIYGKYNPIRRMQSGWDALVYRIRKN